MKVKLKTKKKKVHRDLRPHTPNIPDKSKEDSYKNEAGAERALTRMKHKDLQKACVIRGMASEDVLKADHHRLASFLVENFDIIYNEETQKEIIDTRLAAHDEYVEQRLKERGYKDGDAMLAPSLRMGYVKDIENSKEIKVLEQKPKNKPAKEQGPPKEKRVKDEATGVISGTKKQMVYNMTFAGNKLSKIIKEVLKKFPDANEKSIGIWYKRAINLKQE